MKRLLFIRFTTSTPNVREHDSLKEISVEQPKVQYISDNMIMVPFQTDLTIDECAAKLTEYGYMFLLFDITEGSENFAVNHTNGFVTKFLGLSKSTNFQLKNVLPEILSEDAIYDKIKKHGEKALTTREKKYLQKLSNS